MPKIVTATDAKTNFGAMLDWTVTEQDQIIVQSHGQPKAAILNYAAYTRYVEMTEKERRQQALKDLEALRERVRARNQDLTDEQAMELAARFTRDVVNDMIAEGKIKYEGRID
ncbi:MAG: type II toxin-antitoxin system Phd/YefM family antitoxin [Caldilineaceae bacterium]